MNKTLKIHFYLKTRSGNAETELPIYMRITVDGARVEFSTQRVIAPAQWDNEKTIAKGTGSIARQLNSFLDLLRTQAYEAQRELLNKGHEVSVQAIKKILYGESESIRTVCEVYEHVINQVKELVGRDYAIGTLRRYNASYAALTAFLASKYKLKDLPIRDLSMQFIVDFEFYLKTVRRVQHNTAMSIIKKLKRVIHVCLANDWLEKDPFLRYRITMRDTNRGYLTEEELIVVRDKVFVSERLTLVRDIFVFCCFTGLSYSDVKMLVRQNIVTGADGKQWIHTTRLKTKIAVHVPILQPAIEILRRYELHIKCINGGQLLPVPSNQKTNEYLKEIAERCNISKILTFHVARHTFATTVTLTNGVPIETVSKLLGHKLLRITQQYAKINDLKISIDMSSLHEKFGQAKSCKWN